MRCIVTTVAAMSLPMLLSGCLSTAPSAATPQISAQLLNAKTLRPVVGAQIWYRDNKSASLCASDNRGHFTVHPTTVPLHQRLFNEARPQAQLTIRYQGEFHQLAVAATGQDQQLGPIAILAKPWQHVAKQAPLSPPRAALTPQTTIDLCDKATAKGAWQMLYSAQTVEQHPQSSPLQQQAQHNSYQQAQLLFRQLQQQCPLPEPQRQQLQRLVQSLSVGSQLAVAD
ncbi:hypothetical protein [uncultured Ferrimonas sp.]|uniref:hypothetical protein n=1 Tax=uncultured Ferrimonas sp. TaxID=432640 RepID=UPI00262CF794|nr:hypothetical protein [uncultured Ferrimonas sp.]